MPKRDLSPAAVAEILHAKFTEDGTVTSSHRMRETLATSTEARGREWTERALADGAVVCLVTHRTTGRVLAVEVPRDPDSPRTDQHADGIDGLDRRAGVTYTLWADTPWADLTPPVIEWDGTPRDRDRGPGFQSSSGHFVVARDDVEALCRVVMDRKAAKEAEEAAEAAALDAAGVGRLRDALAAVGVTLDRGAWHTMMTPSGGPTVMLTLRGQAAIDALTGALTTTERTHA